MIYVSYSDENPMEMRLRVAQQTIDAVFDEVDYAIAFAVKISEAQHPNFWRSANQISLSQRPLIVFAVRYELEDDFPIYEISWNPIFEPEFGVALSDEWIEETVQIEELPDDNKFLHIRRLAARQYEQIA